MLRVVRVRQPETIADPAIRSLILRGIVAASPFDIDAHELYAEWAGLVHLDRFGLFVAIEDDEADGVAVVTLPTSLTMIEPQMLFAYNEGRPALARLVGARVRGWLLENGYRRMWALNPNYEDAVFLRGFTHFGQPRIVGSMIEWGF